MRCYRVAFEQIKNNTLVFMTKQFRNHFGGPGPTGTAHFHSAESFCCQSWAVLPRLPGWGWFLAWAAPQTAQAWLSGCYLGHDEWKTCQHLTIEQHERRAHRLLRMQPSHEQTSKGAVILGIPSLFSRLWIQYGPPPVRRGL